MTKKKLLAGLMLLVAGSLLIGACSGQQTPAAAPTVDANAIYTQAAQTVQAGLAQTQAVLPATDTPAAEPTAQPTATLDPNVALALTATAQSVLPGAPTATLAAGQATPTTGPAGLTIPTATKAVLPTATKAVVSQPKPTGDKAELVSQDPTDGTTVSKKDVITTRLTLKNTGTTTWKKGTYGLAFYAGDKLGSPTDYQMPNDVKPGETVTLVFELTAPDSSGSKKVIWVVHNADGVNFYSLWLEVNVS